MGLFRLWRWIRAAVLELTGVIVCLMLIGFPLTERAETPNGTLATTPSPSTVSEQTDNHRENAGHQPVRRFLAGIMREFVNERD